MKNIISPRCKNRDIKKERERAKEERKGKKTDRWRLMALPRKWSPINSVQCDFYSGIVMKHSLQKEVGG